MTGAGSSLLRDSHPGPGPEDRYAGTRALWLKVIIRAVFDWVSYRDSTRLQQRKYADTAKVWLFEESRLMNGFTNICESLDIDPERIRRWAKTMSKEQVAKIEHLDREPSGAAEDLGTRSKYLAAHEDEDDYGDY